MSGGSALVKDRECPYCGGNIALDDIKCEHCNRSLVSAFTQESVGRVRSRPLAGRPTGLIVVSLIFVILSFLEVQYLQPAAFLTALGFSLLLLRFRHRAARLFSEFILILSGIRAILYLLRLSGIFS